MTVIELLKSVATDTWDQLTTLGKCTIGVPLIVFLEVFVFLMIIIMTPIAIVTFYMISFITLVNDSCPTTLGYKLFEKGLFVKKKEYWRYD